MTKEGPARNVYVILKPPTSDFSTFKYQNNPLFSREDTERRQDYDVEGGKGWYRDVNSGRKTVSLRAFREVRLVVGPKRLGLLCSGHWNTSLHALLKSIHALNTSTEYPMIYSPSTSSMTMCKALSEL